MAISAGRPNPDRFLAIPDTNDPCSVCGVSNLPRTKGGAIAATHYRQCLSNIGEIILALLQVGMDFCFENNWNFLKIFRLLAPCAFRPPTLPTSYKLWRTSRGRPRSRTRPTAMRCERESARERERIEGSGPPLHSTSHSHELQQNCLLL